MKVFKVILNALFPNKCVSCGQIIDKEEFLCQYCYEMLKRIDLSKRCLRCGLLKKDCACKYRVYHFGGCVAPFVNEGIAQKAMYSFKFKRVALSGEFFAFEMAKAVKTVYNDIEFDGIVYVPMHRIKQLKRGFNQSQELAISLSKILGVRVYDRLLSCKYNSKTQHDMPLKERFKNVKGMYGYKYKITGKTVLLVDDIKTTGASLDECARQLLLAGADNVYCVTGLITESKKGKK